MQLATQRLILRPWRDSDAADLYEYARDPRVGPVAGWPPHASVEESADIIRTVFNRPEVYALQSRENGRAIGCVG
ncbi:GNAT family N-acetyltransferase, partial [Enterobacter hormaechei]